MQQRLIAFLRAINVGGHTVKMDQLRRHFAELKLPNVETFIASGNVIFDAPGEEIPLLEKRIERHLRDALGYEVATFIRSGPELAAIAAYEPFPTAELERGGALYIGFLGAAPAAAAQQKLLAFRNEVDDFHVHGREVYWLARRNTDGSTFSGARLEKTLGMPATLRNATTVRKLAAKYGS